MIKNSKIVGLPQQQLPRSIDRDMYVLITNVIMLTVCCNVININIEDKGNMILLINCCGLSLKRLQILFFLL